MTTAKPDDVPPAGTARPAPQAEGLREDRFFRQRRLGHGENSRQANGDLAFASYASATPGRESGQNS